MHAAAALSCPASLILCPCRPLAANTAAHPALPCAPRPARSQSSGRNSLVIPAAGAGEHGWMTLRDSIQRVCSLNPAVPSQV